MSRETSVHLRLVGVYEPDTDSFSIPDHQVEGAEARRLVINGDADRINRGKAIRLRRSSKALPLRTPKTLRSGASASPTMELIERALDGSLSAGIACHSWAGSVVSSDRMRASVRGSIKP